MFELLVVLLLAGILAALSETFRAAVAALLLGTLALAALAVAALALVVVATLFHQAGLSWLQASLATGCAVLVLLGWLATSPMPGKPKPRPPRFVSLAEEMRHLERGIEHRRHERDGP